VASIAEFRLPTGEFCLAETVSITDASFELLQIVACDSACVLPFVRATGDERTLDGLDELLAADPTVETVERVAAMEDSRLYRVEWVDSIETTVHLLLEEGATILDASGYDGTWHLQIFFADHDLVSAAYEVCEDYGIDVSIERINRLSETSEYGHLGLTERQYETLVRAYEFGYYDVPRGVNQEELAGRFDVSHQALSERLRRAHGTVITNALYHKIHRRDHAVSPRVRHEVDI
jgi:predicted DNA binding protein